MAFICACIGFAVAMYFWLTGKIIPLRVSEGEVRVYEGAEINTKMCRDLPTLRACQPRRLQPHR